MSQQSIYQAWKPTVEGKGIDVDKQYGDQCVDVVLSYGQALFPGVHWSTLFPPVMYAKQLGAIHNPTYFDWIENDHNNPNQLPVQGDILVCDYTPQSGYSNPYPNIAGHAGVVDSADSNGYTLVMQDGSNPNGVTFDQHSAWRYRPVLGWLRPKVGVEVSPPTPANPVGHNVYLPPTTGPWHLYPEGGPYTYAAAGNHLLVPSMFGGLTYGILADRGNGIYTIQTEDWGRGDIYTRGSDVIIT